MTDLQKILNVFSVIHEENKVLYKLISYSLGMDEDEEVVKTTLSQWNTSFKKAINDKYEVIHGAKNI